VTRSVYRLFIRKAQRGQQDQREQKILGPLQGLAALVVLSVESWQLISHTKFTSQSLGFAEEAPQAAVQAQVLRRGRA
jgi:hypothetical protein